MEMAAVEEMIQIALDVKPDLATLVPERREELTTEGGLDVVSQADHYANVTSRLQAGGVRISFFVDPDPDQVRAAKQCGADVVEIHTGHYSEARTESEATERFERIASAVKLAVEMGVSVSAGHGLNYANVKRFRALPQIDEYSIGHSIVARAIFVGFEGAVKQMVDLVKEF
jgi:pyridoxine 5-phosphate synthase